MAIRIEREACEEGECFVYCDCTACKQDDQLYNRVICYLSEKDYDSLSESQKCFRYRLITAIRRRPSKPFYVSDILEILDSFDEKGDLTKVLHPCELASIASRIFQLCELYECDVLVKKLCNLGFKFKHLKDWDIVWHFGSLTKYGKLKCDEKEWSKVAHILSRHISDFSISAIVESLDRFEYKQNQLM